MLRKLLIFSIIPLLLIVPSIAFGELMKSESLVNSLDIRELKSQILTESELNTPNPNVDIYSLIVNESSDYAFILFRVMCYDCFEFVMGEELPIYKPSQAMRIGKMDLKNFDIIAKSEISLNHLMHLNDKNNEIYLIGNKGTIEIYSSTSLQKINSVKLPIRISSDIVSSMIDKTNNFLIVSYIHESFLIDLDSKQIVKSITFEKNIQKVSIDNNLKAILFLLNDPEKLNSPEIKILDYSFEMLDQIESLESSWYYEKILTNSKTHITYLFSRGGDLTIIKYDGGQTNINTIPANNFQYHSDGREILLNTEKNQLYYSDNDGYPNLFFRINLDQNIQNPDKREFLKSDYKTYSDRYKEFLYLDENQDHIYLKSGPHLIILDSNLMFDVESEIRDEPINSEYIMKKFHSELNLIKDDMLNHEKTMTYLSDEEIQKFYSILKDSNQINIENPNDPYEAIESIVNQNPMMKELLKLTAEAMVKHLDDNIKKINKLEIETENKITLLEISETEKKSLISIIKDEGFEQKNYLKNIIISTVEKYRNISNPNIDFNNNSSIDPEPIIPTTIQCGAGTLLQDGICIIDKSQTTETKSSGGGCLIATATFDSELAPQVQKLREIRDSKLLQTESGTGFMEHFNSFYYSFSPIIADYERENPVFKELVKIAITPMLSTLSLMDYADTESEVLGIGISLIILNGIMYVGLPVFGIMFLRKQAIQ